MVDAACGRRERSSHYHGFNGEREFCIGYVTIHMHSTKVPQQFLLDTGTVVNKYSSFDVNGNEFMPIIYIR